MNKIAIEENLDVRIESAGIFAKAGEPATNEAIIVMKKYDIDLLSHHAQEINSELIEKSDVILTMTEGQKMLFGDMAKDKTYTLCEYAGVKGDIEDPFGGDVLEYEETAQAIYFALEAICERIKND